MGIKVRVDFYFEVKEVVGQSKIEIEIENATLNNLLNELSVKFGRKFKELLFDPESDEIRPYFHVLVNGRKHQNLKDGFNTSLNDGDVVAIFSPVAGG